MTTRAQCRNGHAWAPGQSTCPDCGAGPRLQWDPEQAVRPAGFPYRPAEWVTVGAVLVAMGIAFLLLREKPDEPWLVNTLVALAIASCAMGAFFGAVGAVITGVRIALQDRDQP